MLSNLKYPYHNNWTISKEVAIIGYAFNGDGDWLSTVDLIDRFSEVNNESDFKTLLHQLNGCFAVVINKELFNGAAVDRVRSYPILYTYEEERWSLVNDLNEINFNSLSPNAIKEFEKCWCVLGNKTLVNNLFQLQAGQYLFDDGTVKSLPKYYYKHIVSLKEKRINIDIAATVIDTAFERCMPLLRDKTILVPLSGGYDSRLIIAKLVQVGYKDVLAYTYGKKDSHEVQTAAKICKQLNVRWEFVSYDDAIFEAFFSKEWDDYSRQNHFYSSLPHEQDFFALLTLKNRGLLPSNFVAIPGFCGDLLGGSITGYQPDDWSKHALLQFLKEKHLQGADIELDGFNGSIINDETSFYDTYQQWFVTNKVSKFIVNSVRLYEYFNGDWLLPLWDQDLIDYWYSVPYENRKKQKFYNKVLFTKYFEPLDIAFIKPKHDDNYPNSIKERIKKGLPKPIVQSILRMKKRIEDRDVNNLSELNRRIKERLEVNIDTSEVNNSHAIYFIENLNK